MRCIFQGKQSNILRFNLFLITVLNYFVNLKELIIQTAHLVALSTVAVLIRVKNSHVPAAKDILTWPVLVNMFNLFGITDLEVND